MAEIKKNPEVKTNNEVKYKTSAGAFFQRVDSFFGVTEKLASMKNKLEETFKTKKIEGEAKKVETGGFFERLGKSLDSTVATSRERMAKTINNVSERIKSDFAAGKAELAELSERREKLGIIDTGRSVLKDMKDGVKAGVDKIQERWQTATVDQLVKERAQLKAEYEESKKLKSEGKTVPEKAIKSQAQLREALRPIRAAELEARAERRRLKVEAEILRKRIDKKTNAKDLLNAAKKKSAVPSNGAVGSSLAGAAAI